MDDVEVAAAQLGRMRGMTRFYHQRFFADVRFVTVVVIALLTVGWWGVPEAFLLVPVIALIGANQTAFDASYLIFARHYAAALEKVVNARTDSRWLVAAEIESAYLFPLDDRKLVAVRFGVAFSWFGWMTVLYTALGALAYGAGLILGWETLSTAPGPWPAVYLAILAAVTIASLVVGWWWFVVGTGESRLRNVIASNLDPSAARPV